MMTDEQDDEDFEEYQADTRMSFDEWWGPLNPLIARALKTAAKGLSLSARRQFGLDCEEREIEVTNCIAAIVKSVQDQHMEFRRAAVSLLAGAFRRMPATLKALGYIPDELRPAIRPLTEALADEDAEVRETALRGIEDTLSMVDVAVVRAIAKHALTDPKLK